MDLKYNNISNPYFISSIPDFSIKLQLSFVPFGTKDFIILMSQRQNVSLVYA